MISWLKKTRTFFEQVYNESLKITWSKKQETINTTMVVLVAVVVMSLFFLMADILAYNGVNYILNFGS